MAAGGLDRRGGLPRADRHPSFHGGFQRAFVHPVVLTTVLLSIRRHHLAAALTAAGSAMRNFAAVYDIACIARSHSSP